MVEDEISRLAQECMRSMNRLRRLRPARDKSIAGMTASEIHVMGTIMMVSHHRDAVTPSALLRHMHMSKSALSQVLKSLEDKGLITRARHESDNRVVIISFTQSGCEAMEIVREDRESYMRGMCQYLGADDMRELARILDRIADYHETSGEFVKADRSGCCAQRNGEEDPCA